MVKFLGSLFVLLCFQIVGYSQSELYRMVSKHKNQYHVPQVQLFDLNLNESKNYEGKIEDVVELTLNKDELANLFAKKHPVIQLLLPLDKSGNLTKVTLYKKEIFTDGFKVYLNDNVGGKEIATLPSLQYRGIIEDGTSQSMAAFTFFENTVNAVMANLSRGNINLTKDVLAKDNDNAFVLFQDQNIIDKRGIPQCGLTDEMEAIAKDASQQELNSSKYIYANCATIGISVHTDHLLYQNKSQSTNAVQEYVISLFNVISAFYENDEMKLGISEIVISTENENYSYESSLSVLQGFGNKTRRQYKGEVACLLTGYKSNSGRADLGGVAWLAQLCQDPRSGQQTWIGPYNIVNINGDEPVPDMPIYSWDVNATAHEIGHNLGSPHTHSCNWPGGPIDNCVAVDDGPCPAGPPPSSEGGTVMSYCHLTGYNVNLALGFGPLPKDLIHGYLYSAECMVSQSLEKTLDVASVEKVANVECFDGEWTYYYNDNGTLGDEDDELVLAIKKNGLDIGNVTDDSFEVKVITTEGYGSGNGRTVNGQYAEEEDWREINKVWQIRYAEGKAPTAAIDIIIPYTKHDYDDIVPQGSGANTIQQVNVVVFRTADAVADPETAPKDDVRLLDYGSNPNSFTWAKREGTENFDAAILRATSAIYGITMGLVTSTASLNNWKQNLSLDIYPNPVSEQLFIVIPDEMKGQTANLEIYDQLGRVVSKYAVNGDNSELIVDVASLSNGIYVIKCNFGADIFTQKFTKK